ncbi:MAG: T9SS type A sorting domain-containing protein [Cytophagales bacterium]
MTLLKSKSQLFQAIFLILLFNANFKVSIAQTTIWTEGFETYANNATVAVDNNTNDVGVDWTVEPIGNTGTAYRVSNALVINGVRAFVARNTGLGISKTWQTETIDISAYENVSASVLYSETGTLEPADSILIEYRLDGGTWIRFTNGFVSDDMSVSQDTATISGILGCILEIRVTAACDATNEYWTFDDVLVEGFSASDYACFTAASMSVSETGTAAASDYTFSQTVPSDGVLDLDVSVGSLVRIVLPNGDFSSATALGSTFDGNAIAAFITQTSDTLEFLAPSTVAEGAAFDILIIGATNPAAEDQYTASLEAVNDEGGINHFNYSYTVGPASIWFEDFESYADNATVAVDNNANDVGIDWTLDPIGLTGTTFRVEDYYMIDGARGLIARNTGLGISKSWTTETIDISAYDNVRIDVEYGEFGTMEAADSIVIEYRLDSAAWIRLNNGFHADDMASGPEKATVTGLLGCQVEVRVTTACDATNEYWTIDNVRVSSEDATNNACFTAASMSVSETGTAAASDYTFSQTVPSDGVLDLDVSLGSLVRIVLPNGDFSSATALGSTFDGNLIAAFITQTSDTLEFLAPSTVAEGAAFDILIIGATNPATEDQYTASLEAVNDEGGINHFNYSYTVGPASIWFEDFESYADNATVAVDNNANDVGIDWTLENLLSGTSYRVEDYYMIDGARGLLARNVPLENAWTTETIDISNYDNVKLEVEYGEFGTLEITDSIRIQYRMDGASWENLEINGTHQDDLPFGPVKAVSSNLLGCEVEIRALVRNNATNEYWTIDNVRVSSEAAPTNSCFENPTLTNTDDSPSAVTAFTYNQNIESDVTKTLDISIGNQIIIVLPNGDFSTAILAGSTFNGVAISSFTTQNNDTLIFNAPTGISEGVNFDIIINNVTNPAETGFSSSKIIATNDGGGINHFNYRFSVSPINIYARLDGDWNNSSTWSTIGIGEATCDCEPGTSSIVLIDGFDVNSPASDVNINSLIIQNDVRNDDASLTINGGVNFTVNDNLDLELDDGGENTTLSVNGAGTQLNVGDSLTLLTSIGGDLSLLIDDNAQINITGDLIANHQGGDDILIHMGNNSVGSTAQLNVTGSVYLDHNGNTGGDDLEFLFNDNSSGSIGGDLIIDTDFSSADNLIARLNDNSTLDVSGNIEFFAIASGESEIELNNDSRLSIGGDFIRNANFGILDMNDNSTLEFNGTANAQTFPQNTGGAGDNFNYVNVEINNSFGTGPQLSLDGDVTITNRLTLTDGIVDANGNTLILSSTDPADITGYSSASFITGLMRKSVLANTDTIPFPVGTGGNSVDYQLMEFINNNAAGISALEVSVSTINEVGNNVDGNLNPIIASDGPAIINIFEDAEWDINPVGAISGGSYGLRLHVENITGLTGILDNAFTILKRPSASTNYNEWDALAGTTLMPPLDSAGRIYDAGNGFAQRTGYTTFSKFAIGASAGAPLPLELIAFNAELIKDEVLINWKTINEKNTSHFNVEKSSSSFDWITIQSVDAAGYSNEAMNYSIIDNDLHEGVNYYRLKQIDMNGSFEYSRVISVFYDLAANLKITLYPNPFNDFIHVDFDKRPIGNLEISDVNGQTLYKAELDKENQINLKPSSPGLYFIKIKTKNTTIVRRIVKSK